MKQALTCLIGSTCLTLTLSLWGYSHWNHARKARMADERYRLVSILQTGPEKEPLKTIYLAELLGLSIDKPVSLYSLDLKKARQKLLTSPLIAKAELKRVPPSTLYIDYEVRHPVAWLADYQNMAIDRDGYLFPMAPFFESEKLPEIYLGLPAFGATEDSFGRKGGAWQTPLENRYLTLAFEILSFFENSPHREGLRLERIDVSNAFASTLGQREVVLFTDEEVPFRRGDREVFCSFPKILRLMPKDYPQQITNFFGLRRAMAEDYKKQVASIPDSGRFAPRIIDLRIPQLAFVQNH